LLGGLPFDIREYQVCRACTPSGELCAFKLCHGKQVCGGRSGILPNGTHWVEAVCIDKTTLQPGVYKPLPSADD
jgi:hypothetical protein